MDTISRPVRRILKIVAEFLVGLNQMFFDKVEVACDVGRAADPIAPHAASACAAFARSFSELLDAGVGNPKVDEPWTNAGFARRVLSSRERTVVDHVTANTVANWRHGRALPSEISTIVRVIYGADKQTWIDEREALRNAYLEARAEKALEATRRSKPAAAHEAWVPGAEGRLVKAFKLQTGDKSAAAEPLRQRMQEVIYRLASELTVRAADFSSSEIWGRLSYHAATLRDAAGSDLSNPGILGTAYAASIVLGGLLEMDFRISRKRENLPQLPTDVSSTLRSLVQITAPWLRGFPTARQLDAAAGVRMSDRMSGTYANQPDELLDAASAFARAAGDAGLISKQDAGELADLTETATSEGG